MAGLPPLLLLLLLPPPSPPPPPPLPCSSSPFPSPSLPSSPRGRLSRSNQPAPTRPAPATAGEQAGRRAGSENGKTVSPGGRAEWHLGDMEVRPGWQGWAGGGRAAALHAGEQGAWDKGDAGWPRQPGARLSHLGEPWGRWGVGGVVGEDREGAGGLPSSRYFAEGLTCSGQNRRVQPAVQVGAVGAQTPREQKLLGPEPGTGQGAGRQCPVPPARPQGQPGGPPAPQSHRLSHRSGLSATLPSWADGTVSDKTSYSLARPWVCGVRRPSLRGAPGPAPLPRSRPGNFLVPLQPQGGRKPPRSGGAAGCISAPPLPSPAPEGSPRFCLETET